MATEKKLNYVILGLLSHEALTGYEIKKRIDTALSHFWGASYGSIYPTLKELVVQSLATKEETHTGGRKRLIYTITPAGTAYLAQWMKESVEKDELRYETLLKLFFGKEAGAAQTLLHIGAFRKKTEEKLAYLLTAQQRLEQAPGSDTTHDYYLLTVKFGIASYRAYLDWCSDAAQILKKEEA